MSKKYDVVFNSANNDGNCQILVEAKTQKLFWVKTKKAGDFSRTGCRFVQKRASRPRPLDDGSIVGSGCYIDKSGMNGTNYWMDGKYEAAIQEALEKADDAAYDRCA